MTASDNNPDPSQLINVTDQSPSLSQTTGNLMKTSEKLIEQASQTFDELKQINQDFPKDTPQDPT